MGQNHFTSENAKELLHANPQLQSLNLFENSLTMVEIVDMIGINSNILELKISGISKSEIKVNAVELNRFANEHPLVEKLDFTSEFRADDALMFIGQLNALKEFGFQVQDRSECDRLMNRLDGKWKIKYYKASYGCIRVELSQ